MVKLYFTMPIPSSSKVTVDRAITNVISYSEWEPTGRCPLEVNVACRVDPPNPVRPLKKRSNLSRDEALWKCLPIIHKALGSVSSNAGRGPFGHSGSHHPMKMKAEAGMIPHKSRLQ